MFGCPSNENQFLTPENEKPEEQMQSPLVMRGCVDSVVVLPSEKPKLPKRNDPSRPNPSHNPGTIIKPGEQTSTAPLANPEQ